MHHNCGVDGGLYYFECSRYAWLSAPEQAFFALLVAVWYFLNEVLSIIENVGRMGAPVPEWLSKYIAVLKNKIDSKGQEEDE